VRCGSTNVSVTMPTAYLGVTAGTAPEATVLPDHSGDETKPSNSAAAGRRHFNPVTRLTLEVPVAYRVFEAPPWGVFRITKPLQALRVVKDEIHMRTLDHQPQLSLVLQHGAETNREVRKIPALSVSRQLSMNHYISTRWSEQSARSPWVHRTTWPQ
jgi:hypothetical protein